MNLSDADFPHDQIYSMMSSDPKIKDLLVQASDLKPGSKAMENLYSKFKDTLSDLGSRYVDAVNKIPKDYAIKALTMQGNGQMPEQGFDLSQGPYGVPGAPHFLPMAIAAFGGEIPNAGVIKGVKPGENGLIDASEAFAERGKQPTEGKPEKTYDGLYGNLDVPPDQEHPVDKALRMSRQSEKKVIDSREAFNQRRIDADPSKELSKSGYAEYLDQNGPKIYPWEENAMSGSDHRFTDDQLGRLSEIADRHGGHPKIIRSIEKVQDSELHHLPLVNSEELNAPVPNFGAKPTGIIGENRIQGFSTKGPGPDPFSWMDDKYKSAQALLLKHKSLGMPAEIHTSSDLIAKPGYIENIPEGSTVNFHMLSDNFYLNRMMFPGNASYKRQVAAVMKLRNAGINVNEIKPTVESYLRDAEKVYSDPKKVTGSSLENLKDLLMEAGLKPEGGK